MTIVRFWREGRDLAAEYWDIKGRRPAEAEAIRDAITVVWSDPEIAERRYSIRLDPEAGYLGHAVLRPGLADMSCLAP